MRCWRLKRSIVAASMFWLLTVPNGWAEQETPAAAEETAGQSIEELTEEDREQVAREAAEKELEVLKRQVEEITSENRELKERVRELEDEMNKQEREVEEAAEEPTEEGQEEEEDVDDDEEDLASKINEYVSFGGAIEVEGRWKKDFDNKSSSRIRLETAEIDFEAQPLDWVTGYLTLEFDNDQDKVTVDEAFITIGNPEQFFLYLVAGRLTVPFGIATGETVSDTPLSITDPLTIDVFETRDDVALLGITKGGFEAGVYAFNFKNDDENKDKIDQFGTTVGCHVYNENWSVEAGVDFVSNVFNSDNLRDEFPTPRSDYVFGVAAHLQMFLGDFSIALEYNGAIEDAEFKIPVEVDGDDDQDGVAERIIDLKPEAWQVELGYFAELFDKETFFVLGYSESDELGGAFAERRLLATIGIWILDDLRLKLEYARDWDYSRSEGGTGADSDEATTQLSYEW